jgi:hypothetical protein
MLLALLFPLVLFIPCELITLTWEIALWTEARTRRKLPKLKRQKATLQRLSSKSSNRATGINSAPYLNGFFYVVFRSEVMYMQQPHRSKNNPFFLPFFGDRPNPQKNYIRAIKLFVGKTALQQSRSMAPKKWPLHSALQRWATQPVPGA